MPESFNALTIRREIKDTFSLSLPLIASQLIYSSSSFVSTVMVARLGQEALAASVLVSTLWMTMCVVFFGMLNAVSLLVSHQFGAKNHEAISKIMGQSINLGVLITLGMTLLLSSLPYLLEFSHQPPHVIQLATDYVHSLLWITPALVILITLEQFLGGINRVKLVLRISILIVPMEILLIWALIFGKFGLPECGIKGIGYGFAISYTVTAIFLTYYLATSPRYKAYAVFKHALSANFTLLKELIRTGVPIGLMYVIEVGAFSITTFWIAQFGTTTLAAHQIIMQYMNIIITIIFGMSQAVTIRIGHAIGKQDSSSIRLAILTGMTSCFILVLGIAIAYAIVPHYFVHLDLNVHDVNNHALLKIASVLLVISGISMIFDNFRIIAFGALRGLKDTKFPMYSSLVTFGIIGLGSSWILGFTFHLGAAGIWIGTVIGVASGAAILVTRLLWILKRLDITKLLSTH